MCTPSTARYALYVLVPVATCPRRTRDALGLDVRDVPPRRRRRWTRSPTSRSRPRRTRPSSSQQRIVLLDLNTPVVIRYFKLARQRPARRPGHRRGSAASRSPPCCKGAIISTIQLVTAATVPGDHRRRRRRHRQRAAPVHRVRLPRSPSCRSSSTRCRSSGWRCWLKQWGAIGFNNFLADPVLSWVAITVIALRRRHAVERSPSAATDGRRLMHVRHRLRRDVRRVRLPAAHRLVDHPEHQPAPALAARHGRRPSPITTLIVGPEEPPGPRGGADHGGHRRGALPADAGLLPRRSTGAPGC